MKAGFAWLLGTVKLGRRVTVALGIVSVLGIAVVVLRSSGTFSAMSVPNEPPWRDAIPSGVEERQTGIELRRLPVCPGSPASVYSSHCKSLHI